MNFHEEMIHLQKNPGNNQSLASAPVQTTNIRLTSCSTSASVVLQSSDH